MYAVYCVSSNKTNLVYYGYCSVTPGLEQEDVKTAFTVQSTRGDVNSSNRADVLYVQSNPISTLKFEVLDLYEEELDAFTERNEARMGSANSLTGPSLFPILVFARAQKANKELADGWSARVKQDSCKTARDAWALGKWSKEAVIQLTITTPKPEVLADLDKLSPLEFQQKYFATR